MIPPICGPMVGDVVVIDRIVEEIAVVEWAPECLSDVPTAWLPPGTREGDRLRVRFRRTPGLPPTVWGDRPPPAHRLALRGPERQDRSSIKEKDNERG